MGSFALADGGELREMLRCGSCVHLRKQAATSILTFHAAACWRMLESGKLAIHVLFTASAALMGDL